MVLSNAVRDVDDLGFHPLDRRFAMTEAPPPRIRIDLDPAVYDQYVGRYQLVRGVNITVTRDGGRDLPARWLPAEPRFAARSGFLSVTSGIWVLSVHDTSPKTLRGSLGWPFRES